MGYELHITRAKSWDDNSDHQITREEWLSLLSTDAELKVWEVSGPYFATFADAPDPLYSPTPWLNWIDGNIDSKYPTSRLVKKMISLAEKLGAKVQGDDGEIYTLEEMHGIDEAFDKQLGYE